MLTSGEGHTALRGKRLSFHLMVQPVVSNRLLGNAEALGQGFLSRLLVSQPESLAGTRFVDPQERTDPAAMHAVQAFRERLSQVIRAKMPMDLDTGLLQPELLRLGDKATGMWWEFYNEIEAELGPEGKYQSIKGFVGKLPEMAARLAANLTVFAEGIRATTISDQQMLSGIMLAKFYLTEALRLFGRTGAPKPTEDAKAISDWLREKWDEKLISVAILSQRGPTHLRSRSDDIKQALEVLERHDHVTPLTEGGTVAGKRVRKAWRVHV